jgi:alpha-1,6-mannosyltransferase
MMIEAERERREMRLIVPGERDEIEDAGRYLRIYYVASPRSPFFDSRYRLLMPHQYLTARGKIRKILIDEQPDLIEFSDKYTLNWLAGIIRKRGIPGLRRPVLVGMSCERMDDNIGAFLSTGRLARRWAQFYIKWLYTPLFDFHIANSNYTADELLKDVRPRAADRILVCPRGVDWEHFSSRHRSMLVRRHLLQKADGNSETRLLLYTGRLSPEKNVSLLVDMMEALSRTGHDYKLIVVGSGPLENWMKREGKSRAAGRIYLLGHISDREELACLYTNADAFVHPNPREPFGIAPLEAMAAGCPVVVPNAGGVLSYADMNNSWIARPEGKAFAAAVESIFAAPSIREEKCERARRTAAQHRWPDVVSSYFQVYEELHRRFHEEEANGKSFAWTKPSEDFRGRESEIESQDSEEICHEESFVIRRR